MAIILPIGTFIALVILTLTIKAMFRRQQAGICLNQNGNAKLAFQLGKRGAFLVQNIKCHLWMNKDGDILASLSGGFLFDNAQHLQGRGIDRTYPACAQTMRTGLRYRFNQGRAQTLTGHFQQAKMRDRADLNSCPVMAQGIFQASFHRVLVTVFIHVNEINNNQSGQVAQF